MRALRATWLVAAVVAASAMLAQNLAYAPDERWRAPQEALSLTNPLAERPEMAAGGKKLFLRHCAECHGEDGGGKRKAADLQLPVVQEQSDGVLFWKITNGNPRGKMPSFSRLPEKQRWQLVMFLRTLTAESESKSADR
jgi:mono/diheme cytochrome c family protein